MADQLDTTETLDSHKGTWDIFIPDHHPSPAMYLYASQGKHYDSPEAFFEHFLSLPGTQNMPDEIRESIDDYLATLDGMEEELVPVSKKDRLNWSPKKNWVEEAGGLPKYIEDIALALIRDRGMPRERAIPVAISRVKLWAAGGGHVGADTRAKAAKAVAEWTALKAKSGKG